MEIKLVKEYGDYYLISDKEIEKGDEYVKLDNRPRTLLLGTTISHVTKVPKLSKENCDEIFGFFDIEKYAEKVCDDKISSPYHCYIAGFNKKTELDKDKLFTAKDMFEAIMLAVAFESCGIVGVNTYNELKELAIERALKPTEIEVEIVMESTRPIHAMTDKGIKTFTQREKLDENGCLILKRI
jgi:hypothetical protein